MAQNFRRKQAKCVLRIKQDQLSNRIKYQTGYLELFPQKRVHVPKAIEHDKR